MPSSVTNLRDSHNLAPHHATLLEAQGIRLEVAHNSGVYSITDVAELPEEFASYGERAVPSLAFPWRSPTGTQVVQLRPDVPISEHKYLWPAGISSVLGQIKVDEQSSTVLLVEGTKQCLAVASWAAEGSVYGVAGCRSWSTSGVPVEDLRIAEGKLVVVCFDADIQTNLDVWTAAEKIALALKGEGAAEVRFMVLPGGKKAGLDDLLGARPVGKRAVYLHRLVEASKAKLGGLGGIPKPKLKRELGDFFGENGLLVKKLAQAIFAEYPSALTRERTIGLYQNGVFHTDRAAFTAAVAELLGEDYRPSHRVAVEEFTVGTLYRTGRILPDHNDRAMLNCRNGMLDLATGELKEHDPSYQSSIQIPIDWDPEAICPIYDGWLDCVVGKQAEDLEETISGMLDPSRTPPKAAFLFGPARSGKSTFLRLLAAMAGPENTSGVSLSQLCDNRFAAANVFGRMLNCSADLSSAHVEDLSIFKLMTGEDLIQADRKYGGQFAFTNRALFAFSANELPTVGESSRAYAERVKPFRFGRSFAGHEDPSIEDTMREELPGILVRWVKAWQRRAERHTYLSTDSGVLSEFETRSDRVRQFVAEACTVWGAGSRAVVTPDAEGSRAVVTPGSEMPAECVTSRLELAREFNRWASATGGSQMGSYKVIDRLISINGVVDVRAKGARRRGLNITVKAESEWGEAGESGQVAGTPGSLPPTLPHLEKEDLLVFSGSGQGRSETARAAHTAETDTSLIDPVQPWLHPLIDKVIDDLVPALDPPVCELCGGSMAYVPPALFWYACPSCHPDTFVRD